MRIDDRNAVAGSSTSRAAEVEQAQAAQGRKNESSSKQGGDSVELSGVFVAVRSYNSAREAQLQALAQAVQSGSYAVNPTLVSRALVNETLASGQQP